MSVSLSLPLSIDVLRYCIIYLTVTERHQDEILHLNISNNEKQLCGGKKLFLETQVDCKLAKGCLLRMEFFSLTV